MVEELYPDLAAQFDVLCFSYEVMSTKPEPRAFLATLERLDITPEQCVFVDDAERNVQSARAVGISLRGHSPVRFSGGNSFESRPPQRRLSYIATSAAAPSCDVWKIQPGRAYAPLEGTGQTQSA